MRLCIKCGRTQSREPAGEGGCLGNVVPHGEPPTWASMLASGLQKTTKMRKKMCVSRVLLTVITAALTHGLFNSQNLRAAKRLRGGPNDEALFNNLQSNINQLPLCSSNEVENSVHLPVLPYVASSRPSLTAQPVVSLLEQSPPMHSSPTSPSTMPSSLWSLGNETGDILYRTQGNRWFQGL